MSTNWLLFAGCVLYIGSEFKDFIKDLPEIQQTYAWCTFAAGVGAIFTSWLIQDHRNPAAAAN
jgi:hypothetical protein